jgi:hypothetical protein
VSVRVYYNSAVEAVASRSATRAGKVVASGNSC